MALNEEQTAVANSVDSHNLVIALPGSGKTHTMISFIANLVKKPQAKILGLTFTNAAAVEMKARVGKSIKGEDRKRIFISTFHSIIIQMVKKHPELAGRERLIGPAENRYNYFIFKSMCSSYNTNCEPRDESVKPFTEKEQKGLYAMTLNIVKNRLLSLNAEYCAESKRFKSVMGFDYFDFYCDKMQELNVWPLDLMCNVVTKMLIAGKIEPINCTALVVDEFQDTDDTQYQWIKAHGKNGTLITVVGDDDQAIYSWRNSLGMEGVERFKKDFNPNYYTLSMCYRCPPEILLSAEQVVIQNSNRVPKSMNTLDTSGDIYLLATTDEMNELSYMLSGMRKHHLESRAILTRTNQQLDEIEAFLKIENIPYKRLNGTPIWQNENLLFWVHLLYTVVEARDSKYLKSILVELHEDQHVILDIIAKSKGVGFTHIDDDEMSWSDVTVALHEQCRLSGNKGGERNDIEVEKLLNILHDEFQPIVSKPKAEFFDTFKKIVLGMKHQLILRITGIIELSEMRQIKELDDDVVILTTFHGAKGLEWDVVWIAGANEDKLPLINKKIDPSTINYEEERRLLYVAMTRAKLSLYISWYSIAEPSNFLLEAFPEQMAEVIETSRKNEEAKQEQEEVDLDGAA
ncbi:ATP-dependent helicase [Shewanella aestuarii]|uniref:DNA 3'-5' helicase n=1 Tax=Shewanella aestuarii TaxID=1028752 RepID=A0A6G9QPI4_9GAMM|nr:ATP-dependent helicase [Shewanella aestuarii]QIR16328.1 ATP-dependent helicase [Shewanella aestuarii]